MIKKQQLAVGDFTIAATSDDQVLPCHQSSASSYSAWQWQWKWRSCGMHPRTLSLRRPQPQQPAEQEEEDAKAGYGCHHQEQKQEEEEEEAAYYKAKAMNSVDFSGDSSFASVDSFASSTASEEADSDAEAVILQALRSDRLLYQPAGDLEHDDGDAPCCKLINQQSINEQKQAANDGDDRPQLDTSRKQAPPLTTMSTADLAKFSGATAMSVESRNPYRDFRESMEAMVMSQLRRQGGVKDWRWLEEMLGWYLRANHKTTHGLIVAAFVDLLLAAADYNSSSSSSPVATLLAASANATNCSTPSSIDNCSCCSSPSL